MKLPIGLCASAAVLFSGACAGQPQPATGAADPPVLDVGSSCPLGVLGATVDVVDGPDGVVMTFTAPGRAQELRARARRAAELHGPGSRQGLGHEGQHHRDQATHHGLQAALFPPARIWVDDVEGGAELHMSAVFPDDAERIRRRARERAAEMMACR